MRALLFAIIVYVCAGCHNRLSDVCDWSEYLEGINKQKGDISIHPSENGYKPDLHDGPSQTGLKLMLQDFRQFEFVSSTYRSLAEEEIKSIKKIKAESAIINDEPYRFFEKVHIRRLIANPIAVSLTVPDLENIFEADLNIDSVIVTNCGLKTVTRGISFEVGGVPFYGLLNADNKISILGIFEVENQFDTKENQEKIRRLLVEKDLMLIGWNNGSILDEKYFN